MTVQQLIAALQSIDNKTQNIRVLSDIYNFAYNIETVRNTGSGIIIYAELE